MSVSAPTAAAAVGAVAAAADDVTLMVGGVANKGGASDTSTRDSLVGTSDQGDASPSCPGSPTQAEAEEREATKQDEAPGAPTAFPAPAALEGVKSKRRAVLSLRLPGDVGNASACGLPLASAAPEGGILALGLGARASVRGLSDDVAARWCAQLASNGSPDEGSDDKGLVAYRHPDLRVAVLAELAEDGADVATAAISRAAAAAPHVVVLRLAYVLKHRVSFCAALRGWKGAFLVIEDEATHNNEATALLRTLGVTSRWRAATSEPSFDADKLPAAPVTEIIGDLKPRDLETVPELMALVEKAQPLYDEYFHEDLVEDLKGKENSRIAFLVRPSEAGPQFCGMLVYKLWGAPLRVMSVLRVAVPHQFRMFGYGRLLMKWVMQKATSMPRTQCTKLTLCSMPDAIVFYDRLGFTQIPEDQLALPAAAEGEDGEKLPQRLPGAIWMEYKCGRAVKALVRR